MTQKFFYFNFAFHFFLFFDKISFNFGRKFAQEKFFSLSPSKNCSEKIFPMFWRNFSRFPSKVSKKIFFSFTDTIFFRILIKFSPQKKNSFTFSGTIFRYFPSENSPQKNIQPFFFGIFFTFSPKIAWKNCSAIFQSDFFQFSPNNWPFNELLCPISAQFFPFLRKNALKKLSSVFDLIWFIFPQKWRGENFFQCRIHIFPIFW